MLTQTGTPFVNVHLEPPVGDHPDIPADTTDPGDIAATDRMPDPRCAVLSCRGSGRSG